MKPKICPMAFKVSESVLSRAQVGLKKYGVTADRDDLTILQWVQHLQEELLDASVYLEKLKKEVATTDIPPVRKAQTDVLDINGSLKNLGDKMKQQAEAAGYLVGAVFNIKFGKFFNLKECTVVKVLGPDHYRVTDNRSANHLEFVPSKHPHTALEK